MEDMIPFHDFGQPSTRSGRSGDGPWLHFLHANGYPPQAYRRLLGKLCEDYHVVAMRMRPLWPDQDPAQLRDWRLFADDLGCFLDQQGLDHLVGVGHSVGATTTLRLALRQPDRFQALVLIDPVLLPPGAVYLWKLVYALGLAYRVHPLIKSALKRRNSFESREAMFANYRKKPVFCRMRDESLAAYVDSLACEQPDGSLLLCSPPEWEARIYATGLLADLPLWRDLPRVKPPVLVIRGAETDTFLENTARLFQHKLPGAKIVSLPETSHLVPLEAPDAVYEQIQAFLTVTGKSQEIGQWNKT